MAKERNLHGREVRVNLKILLQLTHTTKYGAATPAMLTLDFSGRRSATLMADATRVGKNMHDGCRGTKLRGSAKCGREGLI